MITSALLGGTHYTLHRFPLEQKNRSLQAWDAADEYLIDYVKEHHPSAKKLLILNDDFGALACALHQFDISALSDSYVAHQAWHYNLAQNALDESNFTALSSMDKLGDYDLVIGRIPKNSGYLQHQLALLSQTLSPNTPVILGGKTKAVHTSTINLVSRYIGPASTTLAVKKARLITASMHNKAQQSPFPKSWSLEGTPYTLHNHANVFSRDSLDIGARFFSNYLPQSKKVLRIVDLGCGNGVIGLLTLAQCPQAKLTFVDESCMAVASARLNVEQNHEHDLHRCQFVQSDCLTGFAAASQDLILCNPPFHQQNAITDHIAWQMFNDAKKVLRPGGELRIVGNRHLQYHEKLNRLFGGHKLLGSNKKFVVLSAKK
ncbi:23S rRNA (guanine-N-2-) -methyltransferase rlmG [Pseudoalteromonas sp. SW0106-04]|uniref:methyltransferase n=1 Tax=Pseudoalteromonas sp. SW0106-04 TaxID=1702169 RepID=UPI0006B573E5|nr:methyltransferase [Pseudoalteromonas sp. SW0106-04]GAP75258.1 23S rRNA (guanine-N-2-) -methyltransferase rlmG [Pseudoalteromonas sp. SW0106-04]